MKDLSLTNFNVPIGTRERFDRICELNGRTRTSVLIELMEPYIVKQREVIETRNREIKKIDETLRKTRRLMSFKEFLGSRHREHSNGVLESLNPGISHETLPKTNTRNTRLRN